MERKIYVLSGGKNSPEEIAVAFAKASRSPKSFFENIKELDGEKTRKFHEKWVGEYGHSSIAEHAIIHLALENISRLATEEIQHCRLASYTEKSSRYQLFSIENIYYPPKIMKSSFKNSYLNLMRDSFSLYDKAIEKISIYIKENLSQFRHGLIQQSIHGLTMDNARYLLPSASLTNVGMTINARSLKHMIERLLSSRNEEAVTIGNEIKSASIDIIPTLLQGAQFNIYKSSYINNLDLQKYLNNMVELDQKSYPIINIYTNYDEDFAERLIAKYFLLSNTNKSFIDCEEIVNKISRSERQNLIRRSLTGIGNSDSPPRELEHVTFTFECIIDQGAFYDIKRHRMLTINSQPLGTDLGYVVPKLFKTVGLYDSYNRMMDNIAETYSILSSEFPVESSYIVPNSFLRRFVITSNFREIYILCRLRSSPYGHFAYRRFAVSLKEAIKKRFPFLGSLIPIRNELQSDEINKKYFV